MTHRPSTAVLSIAGRFWPLLLWSGAMAVILALHVLKQAPLHGLRDLGWAAAAACALSAAAILPAAVLAAGLGTWWGGGFLRRCGVLSLAVLGVLAALMIVQA